MPRPRKFESNADRQKAYRLRQSGARIESSRDLREYERQPVDPAADLVRRVMAADRAASA